jgi:hypothetical protein
MTNGKLLRFRPHALVTFTAAVVLLASSSPSQAADATLTAPLCGILKKLLPEGRGFKPEGARAQLVMAVAEQFNYDAGKLRQVKAEIDAATTAGCPKEREGMLGIVRTKTLAEAVS